MSVRRRRRRPAQRSISLRVVLLAAVLVAVALPATAQAGTVSFSIDRLLGLNCDEGFGEACPNDYYAKVFIDGQDRGRQPSNGWISGADFDPDWTWTATVPDDREFVPVRILLNDQDDLSSDDEIDISPQSERWLDITVEQATGFLVAGTPGHTGEAQGSGADSSKIEYTVDTSLAHDTDGDGISDGVELRGFREAPGGGRTELNAMGADPCRKTIALEADWFVVTGLHNHRPTDAAVAEAQATFDTAPVPATTACPYPGYPRKPSGVDLIVDRNNAITYTAAGGANPEPNLDFTGGSGTAMLQTLRGTNFATGRRPWFHYVVFGHQQPGTTSSGLCCVDNRDLIVTLGAFTAGVGTAREQSGTLVHELGHALSFGHGGGDAINYKPNYLSVMNYQFQFGIPDADPATADPGIIDFSRSALPSLTETNLFEPVGVRGAVPPRLGTVWSLPNRTAGTDPEAGPVNWNGDTDAAGNPDRADAGVTVNLNDFAACVSEGTNGTLETAAAAGDIASGTRIYQGTDDDCDTTRTGDDSQDQPAGSQSLESASGRVLPGYDDWANVAYRGYRPGGDGSPSPPARPDITVEEARLLVELRKEADLRHYELSIGNATVTEGDSGTQDASLTIKLSEASSSEITVHVATADASATAPGDYTARSFDVTFAPGQTSRTVTVPVVGDTAPEPDEHFDVRLSHPSNATIADGEGRVTVLTDPEPSLSIGDAAVEEDDTTATFTVTLSEANNTPVSVKAATADGTATAPGDYTSTSRTLEFPVGDTTRTLAVPVREDVADEIDEETYAVELSDVVHATIADAQGTGTIRDDDRNGVFSCRATGARIDESESGVANAPRTPCRDTAATGLPLQLGSGLVSVTIEAGKASTDQTPNDLDGTTPLPGDSGAAHAEAGSVVIRTGITVLRLSGFTADAKAECTGAGGPPRLSGSSRVTVLSLLGQPVVAVTAQMTIPLLAATLKLNETVVGPDGITQRALALDNLVGPDIVLGEARAGHAGTAVHPNGHPCEV